MNNSGRETRVPLHLHLQRLAVVLTLLTCVHSSAAAPPSAQSQLDALHEQIGVLVTPEGKLREGQSSVALEYLAGQAAALIDRSDAPGLQLSASEVELLARHALAAEAIADGPPLEASLRLSRFRRAAQALARLRTDEARAASRQWLLLAELLDVRRQTQGDRQEAAIQALEQHLRVLSEEQPAASHAIHQAQAALVKLYDQSGRTARACALLEQMTLPDNADGELLLRQARQSCQVLGREVKFDVETDGGLWSSADAPSRPMLVVFYDGELDQTLRQALRRAADAATVFAAPMQRQQEKRDFRPIISSAAAAAPLAAQLGVVTLPRVVVIDRAGRIVAAGRTAAVVDLVGVLGEKQPAAVETRR